VEECDGSKGDAELGWGAWGAWGDKKGVIEAVGVEHRRRKSGERTLEVGRL
jgi:hypothetical protein